MRRIFHFLSFFLRFLYPWFVLREVVIVFLDTASPEYNYRWYALSETSTKTEFTSLFSNKFSHAPKWFRYFLRQSDLEIMRNPNMVHHETLNAVCEHFTIYRHDEFIIIRPSSGTENELIIIPEDVHIADIIIFSCSI